jgi:predicted nucleotidyltransferase
MPTALELQREGWRRYMGRVNRISTPRRLTQKEHQEREQLLARARELAKILKARFGVQKVVLFGSLAQMSWFSTGSDVDLAVEGLETRYYWQAWKLAEDIIADRPVDFVEIESVSASLKKAIDRYGVEL